MTKDSQVYCAQGPSTIAPLSAGSLSGYQFVFKDLFDVQGYQTGAGNPKWLSSHSPAKSTSPLIIALLKQGAECVGRVQTDELAYSLNGQNIHYGTPINPLASDCIPGGSSSGSAVAVARGDADFSIGTDTGGSVRVPASYCGLFGLRPTLGKLPLQHCFELAGSFDTAGIFSRSLALLQRVYTALIPDAETTPKVDALYLDNCFVDYFSEARLSQLETWCKNANIQLVKGDYLAHSGSKPAELSELFRTIQGFEIIKNHDDWLNKFGESLDPAIFERVKWSRMISEEQYLEAKTLQALFKQKIQTQLQKNNFLWVIPTTPAGPPKLTMRDDVLVAYRSNLMGLTSVAGLSGLPQLHLPMQDLVEGPCGVSLMGLANQELQLITTAKMLLGVQ
tara:strand:+ start:10807 stop:11985 length:1179 start_codon:yes stop_codon:yes gene_type:complete